MDKVAATMNTNCQNGGSIPSGGNVTAAVKILQNELERFYKNHNNIKIVVDLVIRKQRGPISLRLLDYFVVNYAVDYAVTFIHPVTGSEYDVGKAYETQMKTYHKQLFDPFRRGSRSMIVLRYSDPDGTPQQFNTTLAQLNFFRWLIENNILDYIDEHRESIVAKMKEHSGTRESAVPKEADSQSESFELEVGYTARNRRKARVTTGGDRNKGKTANGSAATRTADVSARRTPLNGKRSYLVKF